MTDRTGSPAHAGPSLDPQHDSTHAADTGGHRLPDTPTAWVGWIQFAGLMMLMVGTFNVIEGLVALFRGAVLVQTAIGPVIFNVAAWGWIHLLVGLVLLVVGAGVLRGMGMALTAAVVVAMLNAILQLVSLTIYPLWSILVITLDVVVIWAIIVHGAEARKYLR
jgi:hypothetical protein